MKLSLDFSFVDLLPSAEQGLQLSSDLIIVWVREEGHKRFHESPKLLPEWIIVIRLHGAMLHALHPNRDRVFVQFHGVGGDAFAWCGLQDFDGEGLLADVVAEIG